MNFLIKKQVPFLFSVLIGLVTFQLNSFIQSYSDSPVLAFRFETCNTKIEKGNTKRKIKCQVTNHNRKKSFNDITLAIAFDSSHGEPKNVDSAIIIATAPSPILADSLSRNGYSLLNEYTIPRIHPTASYTLEAIITTKKGVLDYPNVYLQSGENVRLLEYGFEVFVLSNQIGLNLLLLLIWISFTTIYVLHINKIKNHDEKK